MSGGDTDGLDGGRSAGADRFLEARRTLKSSKDESDSSSLSDVLTISIPSLTTRLEEVVEVWDSGGSEEKDRLALPFRAYSGDASVFVRSGRAMPDEGASASERSGGSRVVDGLWRGEEGDATRVVGTDES